MSTFSERLVKQMLKMKQIEAAYEIEQSSLAVKEKRESDLQKEIEEAEEQLKKVEALRTNFEKLNQEAEEQQRETKKADQEERTAISQALTARIDEVNRISSELGKNEVAAEQERLKYQRQLEIYSQHDSTDDKFKSIKETRDEEFKRLQEKQEKDLTRVPESQRLLELETQELELLRTSHAEVKVKVDAYVARFASIQSLLDQSKRLYEDAKSDKERMQRTIRKLEEDRTHAVNRAKTSQGERKKEYDRMRALEEKLALVNAQHVKLQGLLSFMEGNEAAPQEAPRVQDDEPAEPVDSELADETFAVRAAAEPVVEDDDVSETQEQEAANVE